MRRSLHQCFAEYMSTSFAGRAPATLRRARPLVQELEEFTGKRPLDKRWYSDWLAHCQRRWNTPTARMAMAHADRFLRWMVRMDYLDQSPHKAVKKPLLAVTPMRKEVFTREEYYALKRVTAGTPLQFAVILGWASGLRLSDVCLLSWDSVDLQGLEISVVPLKTRRFGERATIPFQPGSDLYEALMAKRATSRDRSWPNQPHAGVFYVDPELALLYKRQQENATQGLQRMFAAACKKAGIKGKSFHSFRVTMCSALANSNTNTALACSITGHRDVRVFTSYVRPDIEAVRAALAKIRR